MERASLIYEFNPDSPLFARVAFEELEKKNPEKAIEIIESNIEKFSNYPTPYFIIGLAKAYLKEYDEAENYIAEGSKILGCEAVFDYYMAEIEKIKESLAQFSRGQKTTFQMPEIKEVRVEETSAKDAPKKRSGKKAIMFVSDEKSSNDSADEINPEFKPDDIDNLKNDLEENPSIASETLAGIYMGQKNYKEALMIYETLLKTKPDKADHFEEKIEEIRKLIK